MEWHYKMCVVENMCAVLLENEGGAKRSLKREFAALEMGESSEGRSKESVEGGGGNGGANESGGGQSGPWTLSNEGGSNPSTHTSAAGIHDHSGYDYSSCESPSSVLFARRGTTTTNDFPPPTPPDLLGSEEKLQKLKRNIDSTTIASPQSSHKRPRLRVYTDIDEQYDSDNYSRLEEETELDDYVEQDIMPMNEDEDEIIRQGRKLWEGVMEWGYTKGQVKWRKEGLGGCDGVGLHERVGEVEEGRFGRV
ncbi:MAG: hypothetical protein M1840_005792 [Geoglossum simile]|nr:MAG: hypothetical protein M1840_005792 [Geoglossum simile]